MITRSVITCIHWQCFDFISASDQRPKTKEALRRRRNIVRSLIDAIDLKLFAGKDSPVVQMRNKKGFDAEVEMDKEAKKKKKTLKHVHKKEHIHLHEEL